MSPHRLLLALPLVLAATLLAALVWPHSPAPRPTGSSPRPVAATPVTLDPAIEALRDWDRRRAAAWAASDPAALEALYARGSRAGRADVALLEEYAARGVSVTGLRLQLLAVDVVARSPRRCVLLVTDRLARVVARHRGRSLDLPDDLPSSHRVTLVRAVDGWRVGEVYPAR